MQSPSSKTGKRAAALVVAAGRGTRALVDRPKQYFAIAGKPVLRRALEALLSHEAVGPVVVVIAPGDQALYADAVDGLPRILAPAIGGATRQQSVRNGLEALAAAAPEIVLVHDAARPFVRRQTIDNVIAGCDSEHGAIPVLNVTETVKRLSDGLIAETVSREALATAQTPQGFPFAPLLEAHRKAARDGLGHLTDDAAVAAVAGLAVRAVKGDRGNLKLTNPEDFQSAEAMLSTTFETRTAQGFDVHAFGPGNSVWLCGVEIPHERGLVGHSDADVALHALTDALLGTIGDGDIGEHFPPSDPRWKGASSDRFLADAVRRVSERGGRIGNLDLTIVCESPKIGPHRQRMRERVAAITGISLGRVGLKATTSEGLGFTGRGEGVVALAVATVALPAPE